jgi:hypothetical protein
VQTREGRQERVDSAGKRVQTREGRQESVTRGCDKRVKTRECRQEGVTRVWGRESRQESADKRV